MLKIKSFTFNPYQENTYLIFDDSKEAVVIDPGNYEAYENESISKFIDENKLQLKKIILTHCHLDHCLGNKYLNQKYGAELLIPFDERDLYKNVENIATGMRNLFLSTNQFETIFPYEDYKFEITERHKMEDETPEECWRKAIERSPKIKSGKNKGKAKIEPKECLGVFNKEGLEYNTLNELYNQYDGKNGN